jgi:hypothetical protein
MGKIKKTYNVKLNNSKEYMPTRSERQKKNWYVNQFHFLINAHTRYSILVLVYYLIPLLTYLNFSDSTFLENRFHLNYGQIPLRMNIFSYILFPWIAIGVIG